MQNTSIIITRPGTKKTIASAFLLAAIAGIYGMIAEALPYVARFLWDFRFPVIGAIGIATITMAGYYLSILMDHSERSAHKSTAVAFIVCSLLAMIDILVLRSIS